MIYLALALLGFGVGDLVRWSPDRVEVGRATVAAASGAGMVALVAALSGVEVAGMAAAGGIALAVLESRFRLRPEGLD